MKYIGIDTGVNTGFAVWDKESRGLLSVETTTITKAMLSVLDFCRSDERVKVVFEDARQRKWIPASMEMRPM